MCIAILKNLYRLNFPLLSRERGRGQQFKARSRNPPHEREGGAFVFLAAGIVAHDFFEVLPVDAIACPQRPGAADIVDVHDRRLAPRAFLDAARHSIGVFGAENNALIIGGGPGWCARRRWWRPACRPRDRSRRGDPALSQPPQPPRQPECGVSRTR